MAEPIDNAERPQRVDERLQAIEIFENALGTLAELGNFTLTTANDDEAGALIVRVHGLCRSVDVDGYTVFTPRATTSESFAVASVAMVADPTSSESAHKQ